MAWVEILQQAVNYMEEHLLEEINYEDVARQVHMSSYEFHRAFSFLSDMTANTYIRNRRLSLAGQELSQTDAKVIDVALKYGYDTPESFTKAFTRFHGVAPKYTKKAGTQLSLFNPLIIKITMEGGRSMDYRMEQTKKMKLIALVRSFSNQIMNDEENHEIPDFWGECHEKGLLEPIRKLRPDGKHDLYGLCSPAKKDETSFQYGIGVVIDDDTLPFDEEAMIQKGYSIWDVEPSTYAVFKCMGEDGSCISEMWSRFYKEFLPQTGYESRESTDYEIYYEQGEPGMFCELWIPVQEK